MLRKISLFTICFLIILKSLTIYAGLFSFFSNKPDWINGSSKQYPEKTYLIGVGIAQNFNDARTQARAEITKIFKVKIVHSAEASESEKTKSDNFKNDTKSEISSSLETKSFSEGVLEGVTIPETWFDENEKKYYALAILEKLKMRIALADKISNEEETIQSQLKTAEKATSAIEEIKSLTKAINSWNNKLFLVEQKRIVDPVSVPDLPSNPSLAEIFEKRNNAFKRINFIVQKKDNEKNEHTEQLLNEKITKFGFKVEKSIPKNAGPNLMYIIIKYNITTQYADRGNPEWKFYNWHSSAEIVESKDEGKILASISKDGQESHTIDASAQTKAIFAAEQILAQAIGNWIQENILGN